MQLRFDILDDSAGNEADRPMVMAMAIFLVPVRLLSMGGVRAQNTFPGPG